MSKGKHRLDSDLGAAPSVLLTSLLELRTQVGFADLVIQGSIGWVLDPSVPLSTLRPTVLDKDLQIMQ